MAQVIDLAQVNETGRTMTTRYRRRAVRPRLNSHKADNPLLVFVGGGGGSRAVLRHLSELSPDLVAIICVSDDGKDSGLLRTPLLWAPGDIRQALVALAKEPDTLLTRLFQTRFDENFPGRAGQSLGNSLFAGAAICGLDMPGQIKGISQLLKITGRVVPATYEAIQVVGEMDDGAIIVGETAIAAYPAVPCRISLKPDGVSAPDEARRAVLAADVVVIGPGSVFTSFLPALLPSMPELAQTQAVRVLLAPAWVERPSYPHSASGYARLVAAHYPQGHLFDCVLCHAHPRQTPSGATGQIPVSADLDAIRTLGYQAISADLLGPDDRHDGQRVAEIVATIAAHSSQRGSVAPSTQTSSVRQERCA